ncbi:uncharacterized protein J4E88_005799 [Alternaria novae-zelandiae]|uniref:uncharacterized protein n=1 Tax=Alternaria novae-zelandiae TaxID=430562 RepID=UPI0020C46187|nr:uncharacterized protein J4E88_005799 [Alternaria novae-zelandiae]KAI4679909.1 hypothetical protein J4E88_005799 [Alternaria novae-zelandiae]
MSGNESHNGEGLQSVLHFGNERVLSLSDTHFADDRMGAFSAFVTRRMDPEAAENSGLRRWRRRANTVAGGKFVPSGKTCKRSDADAASRKGQDGQGVKASWAKRAAKGLWERVHNRDGRSKRADGTGTALMLESDNNLSTGVRTQLLISTPMTSQIPAQYTQEGQRPETESFSPIANPVSPSTTITTTHFGSPLTRVPHHTHARRPTPDWIPASTSPRISEVSTAIESPSGSALSVDPYNELIDSIERFQFALLVDSNTINNICGDIRDVLEIASNNLLTVGWDLQRLLAIWRKVTGNAANVTVLEALDPCALVSKKHVAKVCVDMKKSLQSYRDWVDIMARNKRIAQSQNAISHEWCAALNDKMKALDVLEALDLDDVAAQVELVMRKYVGAEEEVATPGGPAAPASMSNTALPSVISRYRCTSPSLGKRLFTSLSRPRCGSATSQASSIRDSPRASQTTSRYSQLCQSPTPTPSLSPTSASYGSRPAPAVASAPSHAQPVTASLRSSASTTNAPNYTRPTKASLGWCQPAADNTKTTSSAATASHSHRLASAVHGRRTNGLQLETGPDDAHSDPSPDLEHAPPIPPKSIRRLIPRASSPLPAHPRSDSAHSLSLNDVATTRRSTCSSIYTNSKLPVKANGTSNPGFLRSAIADAQTVHDANTARVPTPRPMRDKLAVGVNHGRDPSPNTHDMAVRMDEIRARMSRMTADMKARKLERQRNVSTQDEQTKARDDANAK